MSKTDHYFLSFCAQSFYVCFFYVLFPMYIVKKWDPFLWVMANISLPFADIKKYTFVLLSIESTAFIYLFLTQKYKLQLYFYSTYYFGATLFLSMKFQITEWFGCYGFPIGWNTPSITTIWIYELFKKVFFCYYY